ncbi:MAG: tetratricopeptide repeat protein, partial [Planctomycetota bacterium]
MSYLLELLGRGLDHGLGDVLARYYWSPSRYSLDELAEQADGQPDLPDLQCQLGVALLRAVQLPAAIERLSTACHLKPDYLAARLALAAALDESGQPAEAIEHLRLANLNHTGDVRILFAL